MVNSPPILTLSKFTSLFKSVAKNCSGSEAEKNAIQKSSMENAISINRIATYTDARDLWYYIVW